MQTLDGRTAIVTGAGSGIGAGIASVLAGDGATVVVADVDEERAAATVAEIERAGGRAVVRACDVADASDVEALVAATVAATGRVDVLASNAGIYPTATIEETTEALWDRVMAVNAKASWLLMRAVAPVMRRQEFGRIVVTSSVTGPRTAMAGLSHYAASKAALMGLVRTAALELAADGITVNAVLPGTVDTQGLRASAGGTSFFEVMLPSIPVGRVAQPADLGWAVRLLASPEAAYITGQELIVDGGQSVSEGGTSNEQVEVLGSAVGAA
jgi:3-oxoacyl-[acyl-carrier protein] reductase